MVVRAVLSLYLLGQVTTSLCGFGESRRVVSSFVQESHEIQCPSQLANALSLQLSPILHWTQIGCLEKELVNSDAVRPEQNSSVASFLKGGEFEANLFESEQNEWISENADPGSVRLVAVPRRVNSYPIPKWMQIGHSEGKGIGYEVGYTKFVSVLGPEYKVGSFLPLLQLGCLVFNDGKCAAGVGFLGRYLPKSFCQVLGFDLFYDFRQGHLGNYHQLSGGFEVLSRRWELHSMASFIMGDQFHSTKHRFNNYSGPFFARTKEFEIALNRLDLNVGYYLVYLRHFQIYASAGSYYLFDKLGVSRFGGKALIRPQYGDFISVELSVSHDPIFEAIYEVNVVLSLPLYAFSSGLKNKKGPCRIPNRQIYQPVDPMIPLRCKCCWKANFD